MWDQWLQSIGQADAAGGSTSVPSASNVPDTAPIPISGSTPTQYLPEGYRQKLIALWQAMPWWRWLLSLVGCLWLLGGVVLLVQSGQTPAGAQDSQVEETVVTDPAEGILSAATSSSKAVGKGVELSQPLIVVDVSGAVVTPGVHQIESGQRAGAAVASAGGFAPTAHQLYIQKYFNAAAPIKDGQKIYIPYASEQLDENISATRVEKESSAATGATAGTSTDARVATQISINTASEEELDALPGIGAVRARQIIEGRPYGSVEELQTRKIVTSSIYAGMVDLITL